MYKGYDHRDVFFSTTHESFFIIEDKKISVQDVINDYESVSQINIFIYGKYTIVETDLIAYAIPLDQINCDVYELENQEIDKKIYHEGDVEHNIDKEIQPKFDGSNRFLSVLLSVILVLSMLVPVQVYAVSGAISDSQTDISPLEGAIFTTAVGSVGVNPAYAEVDTGELAFSLLDPRPLGQSLQIRSQSFPAGLNSRFLEAVLMFRKAHTLDDIQKLTGLNLSQTQLDAATQLSMWKHVLLISNSFHVEESSISDTTVRSLSTYIDTWSRSQLAVIPTRTKLTDAILPVGNPTMNTTSVVTEVVGSTKKLGPYTFLSNPSVTLDASITQGHIVDGNGDPLTQIATSEPFYIVIPDNITGIQTVTLKGVGKIYSSYYSHGRIWLDSKDEDLIIKYNVGGSVGSVGNIEVIAIDSLTGLPLKDVHAVIRSKTSSIGTMSSGDDGVLSKETPVGAYMIDITVPNGFEKFESFPLSVDFIGDMKSMTITIRRTESVVDFKLIDIVTFATLGSGEAFLYKDSKPYRRFAFTDGEVRGVMLPPGSYSISMYYTTDGYSISGQVPFLVEAGTYTEVAIPLTPNSPITTIALENTMNRSSWIFSFYRGSEFLFEIPTNGLANISFPAGDEVQVTARSSDGSVTLSQFTFSTGTQDNIVNIPVVVGTERATFKVVDNQILEPIPYIVVGLFDQDHKLLDIQTADTFGVVEFDGIVYGSVHYVNIVGAPSEVSGYSANGNRFIGRTVNYTLQLYSQEDIKQYTQVDTIFRLPTVAYTGPVYIFPEREVNNEYEIQDSDGEVIQDVVIDTDINDVITDTIPE